MLHIIFLVPQIHMFSGSKGSHHFRILPVHIIFQGPIASHHRSPTFFSHCFTSFSRSHKFTCMQFQGFVHTIFRIQQVHIIFEPLLHIIFLVQVYFLIIVEFLQKVADKSVVELNWVCDVDGFDNQ